MSKEQSKSLPWLKVWTEMPNDFKIRQMRTWEKWVWTVILCMCRRSPKAPLIQYRESEEHEWRTATIADIQKEARLEEELWRPEYEVKFQGTLRELFTKLEYLVYLAIEHFKQLDMVIEKRDKSLAIKNFTKRQFFELDMSSSGHKKNRGTEEKKKQKNRKGKGSGKPQTEFTAVIYEIYEHWKEVMEKPRALLTDQRRDKIEARLKEGYSVEDCKKAIDGCRGSDFHMGKNERNTQYNDIELIFRNGTKFEQFVSRAHRGGITYGPGGKPSNRLAQADKGGSKPDEGAQRVIEIVSRFGGEGVSGVRDEADPGVQGPGSGGDPGPREGGGEGRRVEDDG